MDTGLGRVMWLELEELGLCDVVVRVRVWAIRGWGTYIYMGVFTFTGTQSIYLTYVVENLVRC